MNLNYVRDFTVLAKVSNYQAAADALFISQSTLTRHIQALEQELGNPLFTRTTRSVKLNEFGLFFLPYAQQLIRTEAEFRAASHKKFSSKHASIRVAAIPCMSAYRFASALGIFSNTNSDLQLQTEELQSLSGLSDRLLQGDLDIAFIHPPLVRDHNMNYFHLMKDQLVAVLSPNHALAKHTAITLQEIEKERIILPPKESVPHETFREICTGKGIAPQIVYVGHGEDTALSLVKNEYGIAVLAEGPTRCSLEVADLVLLPFDPPIPIGVALVSTKASTATPEMQRLISFLQEYYSNQ